MEKRNETWIDLAKAISIFGVVLLHLQGYVYDSEIIFQSARFAVALFILIGGYNAISSYYRHETFLLIKKIKGILVPYIVATIVYCIWNQYFFDAETILNSLIHFDACSPMYYVAVYLQLIIISPLLIGLIRWCEDGSKRNIAKYVLVWAIIIAVAFLSSHFSNIFGIIIGGGNLFAGTWLIFWFTGMCMWRWGLVRFCEKNKYVVLVVSTLVLIAWHYFIVGKEICFLFPSMLHGDQIDLTLAHFFEVIVLVLWFVSATSSLESLEKKHITAFLASIAFWGKHSLYIFLYHILCRNLYSEYIGIASYLDRIVCLVFTILVPVVIGYVLKCFHGTLVKMMKGINIDYRL